MAYQVFNNTLNIVKAQVEHFLDHYPEDHIYNKILSLPYFKQKLIAKILTQIPNRHTVIDEVTYFCDDTTFCIGVVEEQLLINDKIISTINDFIKIEDNNIVKNNELNKKTVDELIDQDWWVRFQTVIPCVTYFFGPFDSFDEAHSNHRGYLEDLIKEKAEGITFNFQIGAPKSLTIVNDISDLQKENDLLTEKFCQSNLDQKYYEKLFLFAPDAQMILNPDGTIKFVNENALKLLKMENKNLIGKSLDLFISPINFKKFSTHLEQLNNITDLRQDFPLFLLELLLKNNSPITVSVKISKTKNSYNNIVSWHLSLDNITELQKIQNRLLYESRHDPLTNLPNRRALLEFIKTKLNQEQNESNNFALLFLDLNKFRDINNVFGHAIGDQILIIFAKRLMACVRNSDHVARLSGDEFIIVLSNINSSQDAKDCAHRIHKALYNPFKVREHHIPVSVSIGILTSDKKKLNLSSLLSNADRAMYQAKSSHAPYAIYHC